MTELLELPHLVNKDRVTDVQIGCSRVEAGLNDQRPVLLEFCDEAVLGQDLVRTPRQLGKLMFDCAH